MWMGVTGLLAAWAASHQATRERWLLVWAGAAVVAALIGAIAMVRKAGRSGVSPLAEPGRKFAQSFLPPLLAGAVLTLPLFQMGHPEVLTAMLLLLYGAAIVAGSSHSVVVVPAMGFSFLGLGALTFLLPVAWCDVPLALGFGGLHLIYGFWIYRRYGG